jgi:uncharacterized protein (TIGR02117 family)
MKLIKKIIKLVLKLVVGFALFIGAYLLASVGCKYITVNHDYEVPQEGVEVFIISNGVHADICLPLIKEDDIWKKYFDVETFETLKSQPKYISFGWGDKGFYLDTPTWADLTVKTAIRAAFLPSATAIHVSYLEYKPKLSDKVKSFTVTKETFKKMQNYIGSYVKLKTNKVQLIDCCRYPNVHDNFYEANGSYHLFRTCNVWTNEVLIDAGIKTSIWTPFDSGILDQFE